MIQIESGLLAHPSSYAYYVEFYSYFVATCKSPLFLVERLMMMVLIWCLDNSVRFTSLFESDLGFSFSFWFTILSEDSPDSKVSSRFEHFFLIFAPSKRSIQNCCSFYLSHLIFTMNTRNLSDNLVTFFIQVFQNIL
jgi:hypothetical protein